MQAELHIVLLFAGQPSYGHKPLPRLFEVIAKGRLNDFGLPILDLGIWDF